MPGPGAVLAMTAVFAASAARGQGPRRRGDPAGGGARAARLGVLEHVAGGPGRGQARDVGVGRAGDAVAHDEHGPLPRRRRRRQGHGILVAMVADPAVAHGGDPRRGLLGEVVARLDGRGAALGAVAVVGDRSTAGVARGHCSRCRGRRRRRRHLLNGSPAGAATATPASARVPAVAGVPALAGVPRSAPQPSQNRSPALTWLPHDGQGVASSVIAGSTAARRWPDRRAPPSCPGRR